MRTIVLVTGGFDPLHSGHLQYFRAAKKLGDILIVGVNSDAWLTRKKGRAFMPINERVSIIESLKMVDGVVLFNDNDDTSTEAIKNVRMLYPFDKIIFANGGDRTAHNIPEMDFDDEMVEFNFEVGGKNKQNSSSWILEEWKAPKVERSWGYYRVMHDVPGYKVKELIVDPNKKLSLQKHRKRAEFWFISEGIASIVYQNAPTWKVTVTRELQQNENFLIPTNTWHQLCNNTDKPLKVIEIQFGPECIEEDIERKDDAE